MEENKVYSSKYWNRFFTKMAMYLIIIAMAGVLLGTLALPLVLSVVYSFKWMVLYPVYLVIFCVVIYAIGKWDKDSKGGAHS